MSNYMINIFNVDEAINHYDTGDNLCAVYDDDEQCQKMTLDAYRDLFLLNKIEIYKTFLINARDKIRSLDLSYIDKQLYTIWINSISLFANNTIDLVEEELAKHKCFYIPCKPHVTEEIFYIIMSADVNNLKHISKSICSVYALRHIRGDFD